MFGSIARREDNQPHPSTATTPDRSRPQEPTTAHHNQSSSNPQAVVFKPEPPERPALLGDGRFYVPAYFGPSGWVALDFTAAPVDWQEVAELMDSSYRQVALKRMLKALDE